MGSQLHHYLTTMTPEDDMHMELDDLPQPGERWRITHNTLRGSVITEDDVAGYRWLGRQSPFLVLESGAGIQLRDIESLRRVPTAVEPKPEPTHIPDGAEVEVGDPDA